jgi:MFS family permease
LAQDNDLQPEVEKNLRWNFTVNVLDVAFYMLGLNMVARQTILPALVSQLTTSKLALGLIPAIDSFGYLLPQLLSANYTEGLRRKLPFVLAVSSFGERGPYLLMALFVWWFAVPSPTLALAALFLLLAIHTFSGGIVTPGWLDLVAKVIPARRRGFWFGLGHGLGALFGVAGAALAGRVLVDWSYPQNFAVCFLLAFIILMISWGWLALNREPDSPSVKSGVRLTAYLKQLPAVLRRDDNYVRFLLARSVGALGGMAGGFYAAYGIERWSIGGEGVAIMTAILIGSQAIMNVLWGLVGDRHGHKMVLAAGSASAGLAALVAVAAVTPQFLWLTFALFGSAIAATTVSGMNMVLEFCAPEDRPTYVGLTNSLLSPVSSAAPLIGGVLATLAGYRSLFVTAAVCAALGALLMVVWVRQPRRAATTAQAA